MYFDYSFNGEGNGNDFLRELETNFFFNVIEEYVKIKWIWCALAGKDMEWIEVTLHPTPRTSYTDTFLLGFWVGFKMDARA